MYGPEASSDRHFLRRTVMKMTKPTRTMPNITSTIITIEIRWSFRGNGFDDVVDEGELAEDEDEDDRCVDILTGL